jgi:Tat protein translocase TatB subunit
MFNVGPGELLVIMLVALVVLGPDKLPDAARKMGNVMGELRRMSNGFQEEMRGAFDEVTRTPEPAVEPPTTSAGPSSPAKLESVAADDTADENDDEPEAGAKSDDPAA